MKIIHHPIIIPKRIEFIINRISLAVPNRESLKGEWGKGTVGWMVVGSRPLDAKQQPQEDIQQLVSQQSTIKHFYAESNRAQSIIFPLFFIPL